MPTTIRLINNQSIFSIALVCRKQIARDPQPVFQNTCFHLRADCNAGLLVPSRCCDGRSIVLRPCLVGHRGRTKSGEHGDKWPGRL